MGDQVYNMIPYLYGGAILLCFGGAFVQYLRNPNKVYASGGSRGSQNPCAYRGSFAVGVPILCRVGDYIYEGASQSGTPIFSVNGRSIYRGASGSGFPVATLSSGEDYVMEGAFGKFVGYIAGGSVWRLGSDNKTIVASSEDRMLLVASLFI